MTSTTLDGFYAQISRPYPPSLRRGQHYYNVLSAVHPDLARRVLYTDLDPFEDDAKIPAFLRFVDANW